MKNRYFAALALAGLVSFAACGGDEAGETEGTLVEDTSMVAPITPEPVVVDSTAGAMPMDSAAMMTDTAAAAH
ncbi:MAG: hypothetical protein KY464_01685 [Gemmatimonadetes bacterium]|nr:hypothetical protein [Gemmatimonadota bacterium]